MKKLFTLIAFLTCFLGAKAEVVQIYQEDYSTYTGFPFYVMGYVPEFDNGCMTDYGADYRYATQADLENEESSAKWQDGETSEGTVSTSGGTEYEKVTGAGPYWHQYFIADHIPTEIGGAYTVKAMVKASQAVTINVNMGWGWGNGEQAACSVDIPESGDFVEVEWSYTDINGSSCNLVAQPGTSKAVIEWQSLTVYQNKKENARPITWQEWLTSDGKPVVVESTPAAIPTWMGNAETPWADPNVKFNDQENNYLICAWGKEREVNMNDDGGWDPFPATIEEEDGNHYFIVHGKDATTEGDAAAWDNQFWIQSPKSWKSGEQVKISFRYKASKNVTVATQAHLQNPSDYLIWHFIGDIAFETEWKEFSETVSIADDMAGCWSIAFQLNQNDKEAIDFYFDDLSWQSMVLDEGYFVASSNTVTGIEYDFDNAIEFTVDENDETLITATVGKDDWVNEVMISTVRGYDASFKSNTIKPSGTKDDWAGEDAFAQFDFSSNAKIKLPAAGEWKISIDPNEKSINFLKLAGEEDEEIPEINPNPTEIVVNAGERQYTEAEGADVEGLPDDIGTDDNPWGQPWDNQFWIMANRTLSTGEVTIVKFKYKSSVSAKVSTQCHGNPGAYLHWAAIGDVNFEEGDDWQEFDGKFTVASEANGMQSIAFNMSEIKEACDYYITDVIWMTEDGTESLIDQTGSKNFWVKIDKGNPYCLGEEQPQTANPDINGDGKTNGTDIMALINAIIDEEEDLAKYDINGDGKINGVDIMALINIILDEE
jgi:hypothetical protein